jgi:hypothetical protein
MKTDLRELRKTIAELYPKRDIGDLTEQAFQRDVAELTVALYRATIEKKMAERESIECEHHTIRTHFRLMQSILRETAQQATSLFLTDRRLFRLRSTVMPDQPPTADSRDNTSVDFIPISRIGGLQKRIQFRIGEALLGAGFCVVAVMFHSWLEITGPVLLGLGALGILHALLMPTRWIEVKTLDARSGSDPILIYTLRKRSAKDLVSRLREKLRYLCPQ